MSSEQNKAIARRIPVEVFSQGRLEVVDEILAPDFTEHIALPPGVPGGREGVKAIASALRRGGPQLPRRSSDRRGRLRGCLCDRQRDPQGRGVWNARHRKTRGVGRDTYRQAGQREDYGALGRRGPVGDASATRPGPGFRTGPGRPLELTIRWGSGWRHLDLRPFNLPGSPTATTAASAGEAATTAAAPSTSARGFRHGRAEVARKTLQAGAKHDRRERGVPVVPRRHRSSGRDSLACLRT